ncbi:MAG: putative DNA binding domain-containing protein [Oscillospiraceae bacterium]|nr:putative DNA binding domain-containing protein [Oscillospiraceae bacterium]
MRLIPTKESLTVEFKSDISKYPDSEIFEAIVAFANTEGGELYLGVEDDGTITGVNNAHKNPITLSAFVANNTVPPISIRAEIIDEEQPVLKISVPKSYGGIAATASGKILRRQIRADGSPENKPLYPTEIATRMSDLRLLDYSALPVNEATVDVFDSLEMERLRKTILAYDGDKSLLDLSDIDLYKALGFVREIGDKLVPTVCGILMLGKESAIRRFVPTAQASFQVLEGTAVRMNEDYALPLLASIEKLIQHLDAWNPSREIEMGIFRMSAQDFSKRAIREAIVNAFSHRDYTKLGRVRVAVTDEGLTIANPGGFIEGISVDNLLTAEPHGRNPLLADALKRVGLAEKTGRGIDRIYEGSLIYGRLLPDYTASTNVSVSLFIPRSAPDEQIAKMIADEQNRLGRPLPINTLLVLNVLKDIPRSDIHQISDAVKLPEMLVRTILEKSIESGLVEAYGSGRGRSYRLSHTVYTDKQKSIGYVRQTDIDEARYLELILSLAKKNEFISRADVVELLHVSENKAYQMLRKLVKSGALTPVNKGHYAKYKLADA